MVHHITSSIKDGLIVGIYLDDSSDYFMVKNNIITQVGDAKFCSPMIIKGIGNYISNNIIANCQATWGAILVQQTSLEGFDWLPPGTKYEPTRDLVFTKNIVYNPGGPEIYAVHPISQEIIRESDYNIYYLPENNYKVMLDWKQLNWDHWINLYNGRFDQHSSKADPLFSDAVNMDFRLKLKSPAHRIGFEEIDQKHIGLRDDFPFKLSQVKSLK